MIIWYFQFCKWFVLSIKTMIYWQTFSPPQHLKPIPSYLCQYLPLSCLNLIQFNCNRVSKERKMNKVSSLTSEIFKWYFDTKIVLNYYEKKNVLAIEKNFWKSRLKAENLQKSLEQFIQTCSWRFLRSNKSEQFEFKPEKHIGI